MARPRQHGQAHALRAQTHKVKWIKRLRKDGFNFGIIVIQDLDSAALLPDAERFWIKYFKDLGFPLTNASNGGEGNEGFTHSKATRARLSEFRKRKFRGDSVYKDLHLLRQAERWSRPEERLKASLSHGGGPIWDQDGNRYETQHRAAEQLGLHVANINAVLCGRRKQTGGHVFYRSPP